MSLDSFISTSTFDSPVEDAAPDQDDESLMPEALGDESLDDVPMFDVTGETMLESDDDETLMPSQVPEKPAGAEDTEDKKNKQ